MTDKKAVTVTIYGNEYTLKGEADPAYIAELAKYVDAKMNDIGKKSSAPAAKVAILASMNIADEFHRLEKAKAENLKLIETLERSLLEMKKSSDGSLRHSLEQKEQSDKLKAEAVENHKKLEEAASELLRLKKELDQKSSELEKTRREFEEQAKKLNEGGQLKQDLAATRIKVEELSKELEGAKAKDQAAQAQLQKLKEDFETAEGLNDEAQAEIKDLKLKFEKAESELKRTKDEGQTGGAELKQKLAAAEAELKKIQENHAAHQGVNDQVQGQVKELRTRLEQTTSDLNRLKGELEKAKQAPKSDGDGFLPSPDKMIALFKKIDAILE